MKSMMGVGAGVELCPSEWHHRRHRQVRAVWLSTARALQGNDHYHSFVGAHETLA